MISRIKLLSGMSRPGSKRSLQSLLGPSSPFFPRNRAPHLEFSCSWQWAELPVQLEDVFCCFDAGYFQEPKKPKAKKSHEQHQRIFWTIRGGYRSLPHKNKCFEANRTRKFTQKFGEIFVVKVRWGTFSVPDHLPWIQLHAEPRQDPQSDVVGCNGIHARCATCVWRHKPKLPKSLRRRLQNSNKIQVRCQSRLKKVSKMNSILHVFRKCSRLI